jgi:phage I-like protein
MTTPARKPRPSLESLALFHVELFADEKGQPPSEFRLWQAGDNPTTKGTVLFDDLAALAVMKHVAERGIDFMVDYGHASLGFLVVDPAEAGKAAGWFTPEVRDGSLWATNVRWTEAAAAKIRAREWRYISPAGDIERTNDGRLRFTELWNAALTNMPATMGAPPLVATAQTGAPAKETNMEKLIAIFGLAAAAAQTEIEAAATRLAAFSKSILDLTGKATPDEAFAALQAMKASADELAQVKTELASVKTAAAKAEKDGLIATALQAGKLVPAQKAWAESLEIGALKAFVETAPVVVPTPKEEPKKTPLVADARTREIRRQLGITDEMAKTSTAGE